MICLICEVDIRIETLQQLFSVKPLMMCNRCQPLLVKKSKTIIYEENEWIRQIISRLDRGDLALLEIFKADFEKALKTNLAFNKKIIIIEEKNEIPYPWLQILFDSISKGLANGDENAKNEELIIAVDKKKNPEAHITLL